MTLDDHGNLYMSAGGARPGGVTVVDTKTGRQIGYIQMPESPANLCFGGAGRQTLYICARTGFYWLDVLSWAWGQKRFSEGARALQAVGQQGNVTAKNNTGFMYEHGLGVRRDFKEAVRWYERAARAARVCPAQSGRDV